MDRNSLILKSITYENMGATPIYHKTFQGNIQYLSGDEAPITLQVIRLVMGELSACETCCHENSKVEAIVRIADMEYCVEIVFKSCIAGFYVTDLEGQDRTLWYLQTVAHTPEEQTVSCLSVPGVYPMRLYQYRNWEDYYPDNLKKQTHGIAPGQTFNHYLRRYIRDCGPERLLPEKDYWLHLEKDGCFTVRLGKNGQQIPDLSETENQVYHYLCYLHLQEFWSWIREHRFFQNVQHPLLIRDFLNLLDESLDTKVLLARAEKLKRQIFIFS